MNKINHQTVGDLQECERRFCAVGHDGCDYDTVEVVQNTQVGDHYRVELSLERWRSHSELISYLRWAANQIENLVKSQQPKKMEKK